MPAQYDAIKREIAKRMKGDVEAKKVKSRAAAIFVGQGKTPAERSARAKSLRHG